MWKDADRYGVVDTMNDALYGRAWVDHPPRKPKDVKLPIFTEQRGQDRWDAISPQRAAEIRSEAKRAAAEVMAAWEFRTGRKEPAPEGTGP